MRERKGTVAEVCGVEGSSVSWKPEPVGLYLYFDGDGDGGMIEVEVEIEVLFVRVCL
jgi:hypothetical protein